MFVHQKAWADACRVAEGHDPPAVSDVLCAQAADVAAAGDRAAAEELFVRAAKPEKALQVMGYMDAPVRAHVWVCCPSLAAKGRSGRGKHGGKRRVKECFFMFLSMDAMPLGRVDSSWSNTRVDTLVGGWTL